MPWSHLRRDIEQMFRRLVLVDTWSPIRRTGVVVVRLGTPAHRPPDVRAAERLRWARQHIRALAAK